MTISDDASGSSDFVDVIGWPAANRQLFSKLVVLPRRRACYGADDWDVNFVIKWRVDSKGPASCQRSVSGACIVMEESAL